VLKQCNFAQKKKKNAGVESREVFLQNVVELKFRSRRFGEEKRVQGRRSLVLKKNEGAGRRKIREFPLRKF